MDPAGRVLARARLPEGAAGMARLHAMIGEQQGEDAEAAEVRVGIEADRGVWVMAAGTLHAAHHPAWRGGCSKNVRLSVTGRGQ